MSALPTTEAIRKTCFIESPRLSKRLGISVTLASETFQYTGSFKFRAAYNVVSKVAAPRVLTGSSGNFGQALAYACALVGKTCTVVMPANSAKVKIDAVKEYGGRVDLVDTKVKSRAERVKELSTLDPEAYVASPYDDPLVMEGNATLGAELAAVSPAFDIVVGPVGGGGLTSGIIQGLRQSGKALPKVIGAEPALANDAARSLKAGKILANESEPQTIADGTRTLSLGEHNWRILKDGMADIVEVAEETIREGVRYLFYLANLKAEPTGALSLAAVMTSPELFQGARVCCVVSGGNVDAELYRSLISLNI